MLSNMWIGKYNQGQKACSDYIHHRAVNGVFYWVDTLQLVQHFTHDDDTRPDTANTGGKRPILAVGQCEGPGRHKHIVEQRHLHRRQ